jgi:hypothetical protein
MLHSPAPHPSVTKPGMRRDEDLEVGIVDGRAEVERAAGVA